MARKTSADPSKVWTFGIYHISNEDRKVLSDQFYNGTKYYNDLLQARKEHGKNLVELGRKHVPGLIEAEELVASLLEKQQQENTINELSATKKTLKKYKQAKKETEANRCAERIRELTKKLNEEGTYEQIKSAKQKVKIIKSEYKKLENTTAIETITREACALEGISYEDYKNIKKIGPNNELRKKINLRKAEMIQNSDSVSDFQKEKKLLEKILYDKKKELYAQYSVLSYDTKNSISESVDQAQDSKKGNVFPLKYRRFDGSGKCSNQLDKLVARNIFEGDNANISIKFDDCNDSYEYDNDTRWNTNRDRRTKTSATLLFRIGTGDNSKQVRCKVKIHRKIPSDMVVKYVAIRGEKHGPTIKYDLLLTLEGPHFNSFILDNGEVVERSSNNETIALDIGWREDGDTIRAGCVGNEKAQEMIYIPKKIISDIAKSNHIRSVRDGMFDEVKLIFAKILTISNDPELKNDGQYIYNTRSPRKLVTLIKKHRQVDNTKELWKEWRKERQATNKPLFPRLKDTSLDKDTMKELYDWFARKGIKKEAERHWLCLEWWVRQNRHLYQMETNIKNKALKYRKEEYRKVAKRYARNGFRLCIEDFNKSKVATQEERINKKANSNRVIAAPSELTGAFENALSKENVVKISPEYTSSTCHKCGHNLSLDKDYDPGKVEYICPECKCRWDRDANAVINMSTYAAENWDAMRAPQ